MTKNKIREAVKYIEKSDKPSLTGQILLASAFIGPNIKKITRFLDIDKKEVSRVSKVARKNKIWVGNKVQCEWMDEKAGGIAFLCDVMVCDGLLDKTYAEPQKN